MKNLKNEKSDKYNFFHSQKQNLGIYDEYR